MSRLVVSEFMTLDGVMEAPGFEEHRDGKNAWALQAATEDQQRFKVDEIFAAGAILLGRVTYEIWVTFWPTAPKDAGFADRINGLQKYVVSTTLREPTWNNTTVIRGDLAREVSSLKERSDGDILVFGSAELVDSLLELDLIDELRISPGPTSRSRRGRPTGTATACLRRSCSPTSSIPPAEPLNSAIVDGIS